MFERIFDDHLFGFKNLILRIALILLELGFQNDPPTINCNLKRPVAFKQSLRGFQGESLFYILQKVAQKMYFR